MKEMKEKMKKITGRGEYSTARKIIDNFKELAGSDVVNQEEGFVDNLADALKTAINYQQYQSLTDNAKEDVRNAIATRLLSEYKKNERVGIEKAIDLPPNFFQVSNLEYWIQVSIMQYNNISNEQRKNLFENVERSAGTIDKMQREIVEDRERQERWEKITRAVIFIKDPEKKIQLLSDILNEVKSDLEKIQIYQYLLPYFKDIGNLFFQKKRYSDAAGALTTCLALDEELNRLIPGRESRVDAIEFFLQQANLFMEREQSAVEKTQKSKLTQSSLTARTGFFAAPKSNENSAASFWSEIENMNVLNCPLSLELLNDPVTLSDGRTYEREYIRKWVEKSGTSPMTREPFTIDEINALENNDYPSNTLIKNLIGMNNCKLSELQDVLPEMEKQNNYVINEIREKLSVEVEKTRDLEL